MISSFFQAIDAKLRLFTPFVMTMAFAFLSVVPLSMPFDIAIAPSFTVMAVFYWTIYRPDLLPGVAVFAVGLTQDILTGGPLGLTALILLGVYGVVLNQRRVFLGKSFAVTWWGLTIVAAGAQAVSWTVSSALSGRLLAVDQSVAQFALTFALFPLVVWLFIRTHRRLLPAI
jgi:rod shape-determining protein MreD